MLASVAAPETISLSGSEQRGLLLFLRLCTYRLTAPKRSGSTQQMKSMLSDEQQQVHDYLVGLRTTSVAVLLKLTVKHRFRRTP